MRAPAALEVAIRCTLLAKVTGLERSLTHNILKSGLLSRSPMASISLNLAAFAFDGRGMAGPTGAGLEPMTVLSF